MSLLVTSVILSGSFLLTIILQLLMNLQHPILLEKNDKNHHEYKKLERRSNLLEDHPKCGITTGGKEECWWSCTLVNPASPYPRYKVSLKKILVFSIFYIVNSNFRILCVLRIAQFPASNLS